MSDKTVLRVLKIFVAWPSDVEKERDSAKKVIDDLNKTFLPRGFYLDMLDWRGKVPTSAGNPEDIIIETTNPLSWDIFIGILWKRFGKPPGLDNPRTGRPCDSGFEFEFECAYALWEKKRRPRIMVYRCMQDIPQKEFDEKQFKLVQNFFENVISRELFKEYNSLDDFKEKLKDDLISVIEEIINKPIPAETLALSDREYELTMIQKLIFAYPETSVVVYAPAGRGKSWLMEKLDRILPTWNNVTLLSSLYCAKLDCRTEIAVRASIKEVLSAIYRKLPQTEPDIENSKELLQAIIHKVGTTLTSERSRLILLLDHVELMSEECRVFLQDTLLPELWKATGKPTYYPVIIAFSRFHPLEWHRSEAICFESVELLPFRKEAIEERLRLKTKELGLEPFSDPMYAAWAEKILQISHGHPSCILKLVSNFYDEPFTKVSGLNSSETFIKLINPVIEAEILSEHNLAPFEPIAKRANTAKRLQKVLPYVSVFRFYSFAQLHILAHCGLIEKHEINELIELLNQTLHIEPPVRQAWCKPHETIRRLLTDALYYQNRDVFDKINQAACDFYNAWITGDGNQEFLNLFNGKLQDFEQIYYIVESLYHHSLAGRGKDLVVNLQKIMESYLGHLRGNYPRKYLIETLVRCMRGDRELEQVVRKRVKADDHDILNDYQALVSFVEKRIQNA